MTICDFYIYGVVDGTGEHLIAVVEVTDQCILLEGFLPDDHPTDPGKEFEFESDAYHLKEWAEENGMRTFKHGFMINQIGEPFKIYENEDD